MEQAVCSTVLVAMVLRHKPILAVTDFLPYYG